LRSMQHFTYKYWSTTQTKRGGNFETPENTKKNLNLKLNLSLTKEPPPTVLVLPSRRSSSSSCHSPLASSHPQPVIFPSQLLPSPALTSPYLHRTASPLSQPLPLTLHHSRFFPLQQQPSNIPHGPKSVRRSFLPCSQHLPSSSGSLGRPPFFPLSADPAPASTTQQQQESRS